MRKGRPRVDWTTEEIRFLRENAGKMPLRDLCRKLKRPTDAIAMMASRMRLSLRCYNSKLQWCDRCASWRSSLSEKTGHCRVCFKRDQLSRAKARTAAAYATLSAKDKQIYSKNVAMRESSAIPRPKEPVSLHRSDYERRKAEEQHQIALERWEIKRLDKLINKEKTLLKRMRLKTNANPRKKKNEC